MNNKKCKMLRKVLYKKDDFRDRAYVTVGGTTINTGNQIAIDTTKKAKGFAMRRVYKHLKKKIRHCKIKDIAKVITRG